jgi:hypothetical protein
MTVLAVGIVAAILVPAAKTDAWLLGSAFSIDQPGNKRWILIIFVAQRAHINKVLNKKN